MVELLEGDCRSILRDLPQDYSACICDPPYELGFHSLGWDKSGIAFDSRVWTAINRTLVPGAHLAAFGFGRTFHRLAVAVEDAGFEIRDQLIWLKPYGFQKGRDISRAIDELLGEKREVLATGKSGIGNYRRNSVSQTSDRGKVTVTKPASPQAEQFYGWGTALRPAYELILLARKPLATKTVEGNVLVHGTGALNLRACLNRNAAYTRQWEYDEGNLEVEKYLQDGRIPTNLVMTHHPDCAESCAEDCPVSVVEKLHPGASRFFPVLGDRIHYEHKVTKERPGQMADDGVHITQKPLALMEWLCKLVMPPGGKLLDPFAGSGTTLVAAKRLNFGATGIELDSQYVKVARERLRNQ